MSRRLRANQQPHLASVASPETPPAPLPLEAGLVETRSGKLFWAATCHTPGCGCRDVVLLTGPGREGLLEQAALLERSMKDKPRSDWAALVGSDCLLFSIDLDWVTPAPVDFNRDNVYSPPPAMVEAVEALDGEALEALSSLWYQGKGYREPEAELRAALQIPLTGWRPGALVTWEQAIPGGRQDGYEVEEELCVAFEQYCVTPGCPCKDTLVAFASVSRERGIGGVRTNPEGKLEYLAEQPADQKLLAELWKRYCQRHPAREVRFRRRQALLQELYPRFQAAAAQVLPVHSPKGPGRNDPCPCGSGKKYKKCCGKA